MIGETDNAENMTEFLLHWNGAIDILDVTPVLDDDEARDVIRGMDG